MEKKTVSILVACYNSGEYLNICLDSLLNQTLKDIQIICINDGSTDNTLAILNAYQNKDSRILALSQENKGASAARNYGMQFVTGEYCCFVDSDDWLDEEALEKLYNKIKETDCDGILFDIYYYYQENNQYIRKNIPDFDIISGKEAFEYSLDWSISGCALWKTSFKKQIEYDTEGIHGDEYSFRLLYHLSNKIIKGSGKYFYRQHIDSTTKQISYKRIDTLITSLRLIDLLEESQSSMRNNYLYGFFGGIKNYTMFYLNNKKSFSEEERNYVLNVIKQSYSKAKKNRHIIISMAKTARHRIYNTLLLSSFYTFMLVLKLMKLIK